MSENPISKVVSMNPTITYIGFGWGGIWYEKGDNRIISEMDSYTFHLFLLEIKSLRLSDFLGSANIILLLRRIKKKSREDYVVCSHNADMIHVFSIVTHIP